MLLDPLHAFGEEADLLGGCRLLLLDAVHPLGERMEQVRRLPLLRCQLLDDPAQFGQSRIDQGEAFPDDAKTVLHGLGQPSEQRRQLADLFGELHELRPEDELSELPTDLGILPDPFEELFHHVVDRHLRVASLVSSIQRRTPDDDKTTISPLSRLSGCGPTRRREHHPNARDTGHEQLPSSRNGCARAAAL